LLGTPAAAARKAPSENLARTYVQARAAALSGEHQRSAALLATLAEADPSDTSLMRKAVSEAIGAGDMRLAMRLAQRLPQAELPVDARLLLVADELRRGRDDRALQLLPGGKDEGNLQFLAPLIRAWDSAERRDLNSALTILEQVPVNSLLGGYRDENRALILLHFRRTADAEPFARRAIGNAAGRESRLRLALADAFMSAGDRPRAMAMIDGLGTEGGSARMRVMAGRLTGQTINTAAEAYSELLLGLAVDLNRMENRTLPVGMAQVARYADPHNSAASVLLGLLLDANDRSAEALAVLASIPPQDALASQARDAASRILTDEKRYGEALAMAQSAVVPQDRGVGDWARLGDVYESMKRHDAAADAYGHAVALAAQQNYKSDIWPLHLLRATALEAAGRWPEAKQSLGAAMAVAPEQALLLNFLGYAKLEHGEDLDAAEAMIRKASALAPNDASITDSLGWALYKRGRLPDAIETLQRAAAADPQQSEIHEHLGDVLYRVGRRYEARFAWSAALITAEDDVAGRIKAKIETGLTPATAAP
jgi:tetratricopeptide (TPR) repeat protein